MTLEQLNTKVRDWDFQFTGASAKSKYGIILDQLYYHSAKEWRVYLPAEHPAFNPSYMERLAAWIGNVTSEEDQKLLLEYALYISFFSHDDFASLYRTAMDREITRWVAMQLSAQLEPLGIQAFQGLVHQQVHRQTWFCPVTDSMDINEFYKVNHLRGVGHRPGFATLAMLSEKAGSPNRKIAKNILHYMGNPSLDPKRPSPSLERIVLLEDIVGSGSQCQPAIRWAVENLGKPVLFVPLILCPNGVENLRDEVTRSKGKLIVRPVIELRRSDLLGPERKGQSAWPITQSIEDLISRFAKDAFPNMDMFGYGNTGCSIATFANTPDNTVPIVHNKSQHGVWEPLFPRVFRD